MKLYQGYFIILAFIITLLSCQKDNNNPYPKDISGNWIWIMTYAVAPISDTNPLTPENSGIQEILVFQKDHVWYTTINNIKVDSGLFSLGHGKYIPYSGGYNFIYDSIAYYSMDGIELMKSDYYEIRNDTLQFCPYFGGRFNSYSLPYNGSKFWIKK